MWDFDLMSRMSIRDTAVGVWLGMLAFTVTVWALRRITKR